MQPEKWTTDTLHPATVAAVNELVLTAGSYRKAAKRLGVSHAAVWNIARGRGADVSRTTENHVRTALDLPALPARIEVDPCPDCGSVHTGRCHGKPVAVQPVRPRKPVTRWADAPVGVLAGALRGRHDYP